jgi:hypothetical protein
MPIAPTLRFPIRLRTPSAEKKKGNSLRVALRGCFVLNLRLMRVPHPQRGYALRVGTRTAASVADRKNRKNFFRALDRQFDFGTIALSLPNSAGINCKRFFLAAIFIFNHLRLIRPRPAFDKPADKTALKPPRPDT